MALFLTRQAKVHGMGLPPAAALPFPMSGLDQYVQTAITSLPNSDHEWHQCHTFSPHEMVPRWQMAIFLARLLTEVGVVMPACVRPWFTDIAGWTLWPSHAITSWLNSPCSGTVRRH